MTDTPHKYPEIVLVGRCFVKRENSRHNLLTIRRSSTDSYAPDKWEVPGGKLEQGQVLAGSQAREVEEEVGLIVAPTYPLVFAESFIIPSGKHAGRTYIAIFSITKTISSDDVSLSSEHSQFQWVSYESMMAQDLTDEVRKAAAALKKYLV